MTKRLDVGVRCVRRITICGLLLRLAFLPATNGESVRTSREFFALLGQPEVEEIYLKNDIELKLEDAPLLPVNLTRSISIKSGAPEPFYTSFSANYITNKIRLQPGVSITFIRILLSGILRGTGQHLDLLSKSDGGAVLYINSINHRAACLPFDAFYQQLQSLAPAVPEAGIAGQQIGAPRNISVRNGSLCFQTPGSRTECRTPYLDMFLYGTHNQISDVLIPPNGGYNSFFLGSYGVCDKPVSEECLKQRGADLCLAAAVAALSEESKSKSSSQKALALGLGIGLGGALLLAFVFLAAFARSNWRHRKATRGEGPDPSKLSLANRTQTAGADCTGPPDLEKGSNAGLAAVAVATGSAETGRADDIDDVNDRGRGADGKGDLAAPATAESTAVSSGGGSSSSSSSSSVTIEVSSGTRMHRPADLAAGSAAAGLCEVEVARLNLLANAARGRGGRSAPLDVKVLQLLGQGSFGKVYKGVWHGTLVALKAQVLPPSLSGDARRRHMAVMEAAISSAINHPSIVQTYCYSFRPIKDSVSRVVIKHTRSAAVAEEAAEGAAPDKGTGDPQLEREAAGEAAENEDYGHELLLVLEYCDAGSLRAALDKGIFHQGRPWPWDWRRAVQAAGLTAAGDGGGDGRIRQPPYPQQQLYRQPGSAAAGVGKTPPVLPANTSDGNKAYSDTTTASNSTKGAIAATAAAAGGGGSRGTTSAGSGGAAATAGTVREQPGASSFFRQSQSLVQPPQPQRPPQPPSATLHATNLPSDMWPKLDAYEPDFTQGAFEVLVPANANADAVTAVVAPAAATANTNADVTAPEAAAVQPQVADAYTFVSNTLAGAPTAASSFVSSFSNLLGSAASAADNAAAAAAADRLAMMYLLQQAAAAVATTADPGAGGYAKLLVDFISASNLTGFSSFSDLQAGASRAAVERAEAGEAEAHSSDGTFIVPPPEVVAAAAAALAPPQPPSPLAVAATPGPSSGSNNTNTTNINTAKANTSVQSNNASGANRGGGNSTIESCGSRLLSQGSDVRSAGSCAGEDGKPPPAIRYGLMLAVAADVASGLLHLHAHGVVHGDVKASNVLLKQIVVSDLWEAAGRALDTLSTAAQGAGTGPGTAATSMTEGPPPPSLPSQQHILPPPPLPVSAGLDAAAAAEPGPRLGLCAKVSDFGLSTMLSASNTDTHISATTAAGSLSHMSPELLLCGHVSKANDVYAYGILLFELFTGERAWEGMPRALLPARVALEGWRPVFPPHTPTAYRQLAERCWLADPAKRPHFDEIVANLRALRDAAFTSEMPEWLTVPNPQLAFLQQLVQRRPTASLSSPPQVHRPGLAAAQRPLGQVYGHSPRPHPMPLQQQQQQLVLQQQQGLSATSPPQRQTSQSPSSPSQPQL